MSPDEPDKPQEVAESVPEESTTDSGANAEAAQPEGAGQDARQAAEPVADSSDASADDTADDADASPEEAPPEEAPKPRRRRRKAAEPVAEAQPEAEAEVELADEEPEAEAEDEDDDEEAAAPRAPAPTRRRGRRDPDLPAPVVRAQAKYVRSSARKARLVCDNIRGKSVEEARAILALTPRAIARDWSKLLESAVANAEHNHELVGEDLFVKAVHADEGPTIKRFRPRAMGRATPIRKRTSHLTILLTPKRLRGEKD